jgi:hypothetical protein
MLTLAGVSMFEASTFAIVTRALLVQDDKYCHLPGCFKCWRYRASDSGKGGAGAPIAPLLALLVQSTCFTSTKATGAASGPGAPTAPLAFVLVRLVLLY